MAKTVEFKKLDVMSVAKIMGLFGVIAGFISGLIVATMGSMMNLAGTLGFEANPMLGFGILAIIALPVWYGLVNFIGGAIGAFIYNIIASKIGGIKVEI